jgi:hypothetical protein
MLRWLMFALVLSLVACAGLSQVPTVTLEPTGAARREPADGYGLPTATTPASPSPHPGAARCRTPRRAAVPVLGRLTGRSM